MNENSLIATYISNHPANWRQDFEDLGIGVKESADGRAIFNYGIGCDFANPIVQEARGIILDLNTLDVVCFPFRKFGNYGEPYADHIDLNTARVQEKVDGSIMKLYFYNGKWELATNGTVDAYANIGSYTSTGKSFGELFDEGAKDVALDYSRLDPANTYIFELVSPDCTIVVPYEKTTIYHTGTRCNATGVELVTDIGVKKPKEYNLNSLEDCIASAKMMNENAEADALNGEGYVVVDGNWNRVKVKSPDYIQAHYCSTYKNPSEKKIIWFIREGNAYEIATYIPSFKEKVDAVEAKIDALVESIETYFDYCKADAEVMDRHTFVKAHAKQKWGMWATSFYYNDRVEPVTADAYIRRSLNFSAMDRVVKWMNEIV